MIAAKNDDVPMNMVKAGGGGAGTRWASAWSLANKDRRTRTMLSTMTSRRCIRAGGQGPHELGGKITDWKRRPVSAGNGRGSAGTTAVGSKDVTITKGDVLIIPVGTRTSGKMPRSSRAMSSSASIRTAWLPDGARDGKIRRSGLIDTA